MALLGTALTRREDERILTGNARYVSNLDIPGVASAVYVTSSVAHGRIVSVDVGAARAVPGVLGVFTSGDVDVGPYPLGDPTAPAAITRPLLAGHTVHFVGEPIAVIVSETRAAGSDAAALVVVDIDPLPAVPNLEAAVGGDALLYPELGSNVVKQDEGGTPDPEAWIDLCEVVVRASFRSPRIAPCPLETRAGASRWEEDGRLTHWSACQGPHPIRALLASIYDLPADRIRVIAPDVGGSFGAKARAYPEETLLPWLARRVGRPVRWVPTRSDDMVGLGHSRAQLQHVVLGGSRDGRLEALSLRVVADAGAYPMSAPLLARNTGLLSPEIYRMDKVHWQTEVVVTSTTPVTAYRGAGRPEAAALTERAVDLFALEIGMDPVELRRRNLLGSAQFPYTTPTGLVYDSGDYAPMLERALESAGYEQLRKEQARRRAEKCPVQLGIGVAMFLDRTAGFPGTEYARTRLRSDGSVLVTTSSTPHGQGHHTVWAMLVADRTGLPLEKIEVMHGDTDLMPYGSTTGGSVSAQRAGSAVAMAAEQLVDLGRQAAAELLEAAVEDIVLDVSGPARFHVAGSPSTAVSWRDIAFATASNPETELACESDCSSTATFPAGAYVAVVEVDTETGAAKVQRLVTVDDAGTILNPLLAEGQVHGGAAQGIAQALIEEFVYDDAGNPLTSNFADYGVISAPELPAFESVTVETPSPNNPLGAKGIGESGAIGAPPAVQNAVVDALRPFGVTHIDMPCTPERVWRAMHNG
jgi:aerobic carbon-monoxide dehydrogenase large subunit